MSKKVIPSEVLDRLEVTLRETISAKVISRSQAVMHVKSLMRPRMGELAVAMNKASLGKSLYNVLLEEDYSDSFTPKFINCGYYFVNEMLAKKFGGCVSNNQYWILYDEKKSNMLGEVYGYKGDRPPTAEEIIQCIEELCEKM